MATQYDRWQLKTTPIQMPEFKVSGFTPQSADTGLLQQGAQIAENRREKFSENKAGLEDAFTKMQATLHHDADTDKWMQKKKDEIYATIKSYSDVGDYGGGLRKARELASSLLSDADYQSRVRDNAEYQEHKKTVEALLNNGAIDSDQAEVWNLRNKYTHTEYKDENGRVIGSKEWTPSYMPAKKQDTLQLFRGILSVLNPNAEGTSKSTENQNGNNEISGTNLSNYGFGKDENAIGGSDAIMNKSTRTSRSHQESNQMEELTGTRITQMINMVLKTNPEAARYYYESYDNAKYLIDHYNEEYNAMVASGNKRGAEEAKEKIARYKAQIYNEKGKPYANVQDYILHDIAEKGGMLMEYYKHTNAVSDSTSVINNTDLSPYGRSKGVSGGGRGNNTDNDEVPTNGNGGIGWHRGPNGEIRPSNEARRDATEVSTTY